MLAHEDSGVGIVEDIARKMRQLSKHITGNVRVTLRWHEHIEPR